MTRSHQRFQAIARLLGGDCVWLPDGNPPDTVDSSALGREDIAARLSIIGSSGDDVLQGTDGANRIYGLGGNGDDTLEGGAGNDWLNGGSGSDTYLFNRGSGQFPAPMDFRLPVYDLRTITFVA